MVKLFFLKYILIFSILLFSDTAIYGINVKLTNLKCSSLDKKIVEFNKCQLKAIKRGVTEMSIYAKLILRPINDTSVQMGLKKRGYKQAALYQHRVDFCKFLRNTRRNLLAEIFFNFLELPKYSNINHTCPFDHDIVLSDARVDTNSLNFLRVAAGEYTLFSSWYTYNFPAAQINLSVEIY